MDGDDDFDITPAIRRYLAVFDQSSRAHGDDEQARTSVARANAFAALVRDQEASRHGLSNFDAEKLRQAICRRAERLARLRMRLTTREAQILRLRCAGLSRAEIATILKVSGKTVGHHCEAIAAKTGTANPFEQAIWAVRQGLVEL